MKLIVYSLLIFLPLLCFSEQEEQVDLPCTGTLLSFYSKNVPPGHLLIEPLLFVTTNYGFYSPSWSLKNQKNIYDIELLFVAETGITKFMDFTLVLDGIRSYIGDKKTTSLSDTQLYAGFQILEEKKDSWQPDFRFLIGGNFPTGKHDNLDEEKLFADGVGSGAYETIFVAILLKTFHIKPKHPLFVNLNLLYFLPMKTDVKELNIYGGGLGTKGTAYPGREFILNLGIEYTLSRHFEVSLDLRYEHQNSTKFSGNEGVDENGNPNLVGLPSSEQFSMAPGLQYRHSDTCTIASGVWFSIAGRNSIAFASYTVRASFYF